MVQKCTRKNYYGSIKKLKGKATLQDSMNTTGKKTSHVETVVLTDKEPEPRR